MLPWIGSMPFSRAFMGRLCEISLCANNGPLPAITLPPMHAHGALQGYYSATTAPLRGLQPLSLVQISADSGRRAIANTIPHGKPWLSWWPSESGCLGHKCWPESSQIAYRRSVAWSSLRAAHQRWPSLPGRSRWTQFWACTLGVATHIPGVSNMLPDDLSRMWAPEPHAFPTVLQAVPHIAPERNHTFWKTTQGSHKNRASNRRSKQTR